MASIFSKIIAGDIPCYKVAEDAEHIAFLDIAPVTRGHVLVVPKIEVNRLFDLDNDRYSAVLLFSKRVAAAIEKAFPCDRVGMTVVGLDVPHAHIHLMPINTLSDMDLTKAKLKLEPSEMQRIATVINELFIA